MERVCLYGRASGALRPPQEPISPERDDEIPLQRLQRVQLRVQFLPQLLCSRTQRVPSIDLSHCNG